MQRYALLTDRNERLPFEAPNEKIAIITGMIVGNGIAILERIEENTSVVIATFREQPYTNKDYAIRYLGEEKLKFAVKHLVEIDECLKTFECRNPYSELVQRVEWVRQSIETWQKFGDFPQ